MRPEQDLEKLVKRLHFKASADLHERSISDALQAQAKSKQTKSALVKPNIWRIIMKSRIIKLAAAAVIVIGISVVGWFLSNPNAPESMSSFALLAKACAAEQTLFRSTAGITHIANEVILYPNQERDAGELLNDLESDVTEDKNISFIRSWLSYRWLPVYSLGADGQQREIKLDLANHADKAVVISDIAWFDSATGRFARVLKTGEQVLFANAYDGQFIYVAQKGPDGRVQVKKEAVTSEFQVPENPADFLGIAAGIKSSVPGEHYPPIQSVTTETLQDGTPVRTYKLGFPDPWGKVDTYFLFKINANTDVVGEIECVADGRTTHVHRRVIAETVNRPELSWNLSELSAGAMVKASTNVDTGTGANLVTIQQMAQRANVPVYVFGKEPSWTSDRKIYDLPDQMSALARIFSSTYRAKDGRDITLTQGETFKRYFSALLAKNQETGETIPWTYESTNGFKAIHQSDKEGEMWWTEFALKTSGFEPHANRIGYILMSPAKTFLVLAINGPVSDEELHNLVDSLILADEYVPSSTQN
jgi:hypothetical protein